MSTFGKYFRVTTFGESHCKGVGCIVDGVPPLLELSEEDIQPQLTRRRPGQSKLTTPRNEADKVSILSGTESGRTLGTPVALFVANKDQKPGDYNSTRHAPRPSHADYTYTTKYGVHASSGGGRSSARETGFEIGTGFEGTKLRGSEHNDAFVKKGTSLGTETNNSGGIQGGISNGESIYFRVAFKPPATIGQAQTSANFSGEKDVVAAKGRHDPCVVPRAVPIVESMAALVLADAALAQLARQGATPRHAGVGSNDVDALSAEDLRVRYDRELRLKEQYQKRLQKRVEADARAIPTRYLYPGLIVAGVLAGVYLGRRLFGAPSYASSSSLVLGY
ncbi:chorismate synthase [Salpingoeca rosetta]|uniref:chorismate synthase n=1 Tax=Salpingoeca rosetta (strain ATCC 50818 / BSB-021) TaxID=946362 RepID=F2TYU2_SALR5|nr:chorismate synthase [Salpingoeca rosetta]EGD78766.1 chorismate synthase [Salpingoeca rosetta]|eukprot:XP_004997722.1 chorismate synthase [Salpingoeca rosetta]